MSGAESNLNAAQRAALAAIDDFVEETRVRQIIIKYFSHFSHFVKDK